MPVVIKELVITATVAPSATATPAPAGDPTEVVGAWSRPQVQQLVQNCVAQVLAVLREQAEC